MNTTDRAPEITLTFTEFLIISQTIKQLSSEEPKPSASRLTDAVISLHASSSHERSHWPAYRRLSCQLPALTQANVDYLWSVITDFNKEVLPPKDGADEILGTMSIFEVSMEDSLPHNKRVMGG